MTRILFHGGTLFDGTVSEPSTGDLVVENGRIVDVGTGLDGDESVDCSGKWLSPGFFDSHVHVTMDGFDVLRQLTSPFSLSFYLAAQNLKKTLDIGITSIRDAGGADLGIKEAVDRGMIPGPRMQIAISMLSQTGGHGDDWEACGVNVPLFVPHPGRPNTVVDGPDEVRKKVRELIRNGADVIKVATSGGVLSARDDPRHAHFRDAEIAVMVEEATAAGIFVMSHAQATDGIKAAIRNGVRSIEHGIYLDDEAIEMMLRAGTWLVPTLHAPRAVVAAAAAGASIPQSSVDKAKMVAAAHDDSVRRAHAAGVKIAMGTDCGVGPHGSNLDELRYLTDTGLTPLEALHATTSSAAELFGVDGDRGRLAPGQRADLVLLDCDPQDIDNLAGRVRGVYLDGALVSTGAATVG
ncbi:metal-dependent hydrolase family protein [Nakamurella lactea]|uniref:metal-dependent hydrolase family protein n=1 Tax=Nakamurella lactea TaxID=459515 RepID=UPI0003FEC171|nr:amidohydrolase family protein [Nakamurella lactea]